MARPRKPDDEKLVLVSASIPRDVYFAMKRYAVAHRLPLALVVRQMLDRRLRNNKTTEPQSSPTL